MMIDMSVGYVVSGDVSLGGEIIGLNLELGSKYVMYFFMLLFMNIFFLVVIRIVIFGYFDVYWEKVYFVFLIVYWQLFEVELEDVLRCVMVVVVIQYFDIKEDCNWGNQFYEYVW